MFMHRRHLKEEASLYQIGTRPVHPAFGRWCSASTVSQLSEASLSLSRITIDFDFDPRYRRACFRNSRGSNVRVKIVGSWSSCCCFSYYWSVYAFIVIIIVRTLYEGTLVTSRTTAQREHTPSPPQKICWKCSAQPALCIFLATLTIAARCYASTTSANATHPLVQFNSSSPTNPPLSSLSSPTPPPPFLSLSSSTLSSSISPINLRNYSNIQSSNLLISRLFSTKRYSSPKSDTRLIATNRTRYSKVLPLLLKQNRPLIDKGKLRTKRNLNSESSLANKFSSNKEGVKSVVLNSTATVHIDNSNIDLTKNSSWQVQKTDSRDNHTSDKVVHPVTATTVRTNQQQQNSLKQSQKTSEEVTPGGSRSSHGGRTERPMPPANRDETSGVINDWSLILVVLAVLTGTALGLVTCLLNHQEVRSVISARRSPAIPPPHSSSSSFINPHLAAESPTTTPMLSVVSASAAAGMGGMDRLRGGRAARELAATRDRQVRLHAVHTDIAINLPPSITMPDGEELPFTTSRLHIRDAEQESEIYQKCIRPPPNRTVLESECPPPNRSSSAGVLASSSSSSSSNSSNGSDWSAGSAPMVFRCHSMSSSSTSKPTLSSASASAASGSTTTASTLVAAGQKTDFLQRTVKIFTGKKTQQPPPPPAPTLPIVIVPPQPPPPQHHLASSRTRPTLHNNNSKPQSDV